MLRIFEQAGAENSRNTKYQSWRQDNQPKEIFSESFSNQKLEYIHRNPVEAGIVDNAEDYLYSSARDYYDTGKGLLDIVPI
jgi:putative transposase